MGKFYVQSGTLRAIITSPAPERAAMWAIQRAMKPILPQADEGLDLGLGSPTGFVALGPAIQLSETGFDQPDAMQFDTLETFSRWHDLVRAIDQVAEFLQPAIVD